MKLAHLADLHLGFRQFTRSTPGGGNAREADVGEALKRAVDGVIAEGVDAVLVAGDVFHSVRPTNAAILALFVQLQRIRTALPAAKIVLIAGNHDTPRTADASSILGLYRALDVTVVQRGFEIVFLAEGFRLVAVPSSAVAEIPKLRGPDGPQDILLTHAEVAGYGAEEIQLEVLRGWAYVALGHYHVAAQVAPWAWYSGSLDYTSTDPWGEVREERVRSRPGKGWLLVDFGRGMTDADGMRRPWVEWKPVAAPRVFDDLEPVDATGLTVEQLNATLAARLESAEVDGKVVRLLCENASRPVVHALDHSTLRAYKARAFHLQLEFRRPEGERSTPAGRRAKMRRLDEIMADFLGARRLPPDVEADELKRLGAEYLELAKEVNVEEP